MHIDQRIESIKIWRKREKSQISNVNQILINS